MGISGQTSLDTSQSGGDGNHAVHGKPYRHDGDGRHDGHDGRHDGHDGPGFARIPQSSLGFVRISPGVTRPNTVAKGLTRSHKVSQGLTWSRKISQGLTRSRKVPKLSPIWWDTTSDTSGINEY